MASISKSVGTPFATMTFEKIHDEANDPRDAYQATRDSAGEEGCECAVARGESS